MRDTRISCLTTRHYITWLQRFYFGEFDRVITSSYSSGIVSTNSFTGTPKTSASRWSVERVTSVYGSRQIRLTVLYATSERWDSLVKDIPFEIATSFTLSRVLMAVHLLLVVVSCLLVLYMRYCVDSSITSLAFFCCRQQINSSSEE